MRRSVSALAALAGATALALFVGVAPASAARPLALGFADPVYGSSARDIWLTRSRQVGASFVVVGVSWATITPQRATLAELADPGRFEANWAPTDALVRSARARGLTVVLSLAVAPRWAEGSGRPANARPGVWKPDAKAFAAFARGAARRYSGAYGGLPAVRHWQIWTEPNLATHLLPQFVGRRAASPEIYRGLLNGAYDAIKSVRRANVVLTAGTAPFGGTVPGIPRLRPAAFVRDLLCLRGARLQLARCPRPARFDVLAHHPYSTGAPTRHALNADDVSIADIGKLTRLLRRAEATGRVFPRTRKPVWATEVSYDSKPPDPRGVPSRTHARWLEQTLYLLWRQGVSAVAWFQVGDEAPGGSYDSTYQSGVYLRDGTPKPALAAYRFPLVGQRASRASVQVWGRAPVAGVVALQRRAGTRWLTFRTLRAAAGSTFVASVAASGPITLRAVVGAQTSLAWAQG